MSVPVIGRKFALPALPAPHVARAGLLDRLAEGLAPRKKITIVKGGPGTGKTALLAEYAAAVPAIECWYGLGPGDADPAVFFHHLAACLARRVPDLSSQATLALNALGKAGYEQAMALLCDDLSMVVDAPVVLVVDDAHYLADQQEAVAGLEALVRYFPDDSQIVLAGRSLPPLKLAREQVMGQVVALDEQDLAFSAAEITGLLAGVGIPAAPALGSEIGRRTGGWVTGAVHLAIAGLRESGGDGGSASQVGDPALLFAYLSEEILEPLDPAFREALLSCAYLPVLSAEACRPLLGTEAVPFLERLKAVGPFVMPDTGDGLVLQPMFREFLQREFASRRSPADQAGVFRLLAEQSAPDSPDTTVSYLLRAGDHDAAQRVLLGAMADLLASGRHATLCGILDEFPAEQRATAPALLYLQGELARQSGRLADAVRLLDQAQLRSSAGSAGVVAPGSLETRIWASLAAAYGARGGLDEQEAYAGKALAADPQGDPASCALALNAWGLAAVARLDIDSAQTRFDKALELYRQTGDRAGEIRILHNRGLAHAKGGDFERAIAAYGEAVRQARAAAIAPFPLTYSNLALCQLHLGRLEEAWQAFEQGMALADQVGTRRDRIMLLRTLGQLHHQAGDGPRAREAFESSLTEATEAGDPGAMGLAYFGLAEEAVGRGDLPRARALLAQGLESAGQPLDAPGMTEAALLAARLELSAGSAGRSAELLDTVEVNLQLLGNQFQRFVAAGLRYEVALARGDAERAAEALETARQLAARYGYPVMPVVEAPAGDPTGEQSGAQTGAQPGVKIGMPGSPAVDVGADGTPARSLGPVALDVRCLGPFEVSVEGEPLGTRDWRSGNAKLVLVYLLLNPQGATKERLLDLLYPGGEPARSALAMVVSRLRQALEPAAPKGSTSRFIHFQDGRYFFTRGVRSCLDASELRSLVAQAREPERSDAERRTLLEVATGLYRGPFLEEFPDLPWCQIERENVRRVAQEAWEELFAVLSAADDWPAVERAAESCLAVDPAAQAAHRAKMIALAMQERPNDALRFESAAAKVLQADLGLDPEPETAELALLIRDGRFTVRIARDYLATRW